jgi:hypothetical protein
LRTWVVITWDACRSACESATATLGRSAVKTIANTVTTNGACVWWSKASIGFWNARSAPW